MFKALGALGALVLLLGVLAGCGGSSKDTPKLSKSEQTISKNIAAYIVKQSQDTWKTSEAKCLSDEFVQKAGVGELKKEKLITSKNTVNEKPVEFSTKLAGSFGTAYVDCVDYAALTGRQLAKSRPDIDQKKFVSCVKKDVDKKAARDRVVAQQTNKLSDPSYAATNTKLLNCAKGAIPAAPASPGAPSVQPSPAAPGTPSPSPSN